MAGDRDIVEQTPGRLVDGPEGMTHSRVFRVLARSEIDALTKLQVYRRVFRGAAWYTTYNEAPDASVVCRRRECVPVRSAPLGGVGDYEITAQYETPRRDEAVAGGPPVYRLDDSQQSAPIDIDADGDPIMNLVEEPIASSDAVTSEVLRVEWWKEYADLAACFQGIRPFRNALNLVSWQGLPRGSARTIQGPKNAKEVYLENSVLVKLQASIGIRPEFDATDFASKIIDKDGTEITGTFEGWAQLKRHEGTREKGDVVDGVQQYKPILTQDGADRITEPVPLDATGARVADGDPVVYIKHDVVPNYKDLADLGI
jgi:hypothetical protein